MPPTATLNDSKPTTAKEVLDSHGNPAHVKGLASGFFSDKGVLLAILGIVAIGLLNLGIIGPQRDAAIAADEKRWAAFEVRMTTQNAEIQNSLNALQYTISTLNTRIDQSQRDQLTAVDFERWLLDVSRSNPDLTLPELRRR